MADPNTPLIDQPDLRPFATARGFAYRLQSPYVYQWAAMGEDLRITVPLGFLSDGASVPRLMWTFTGIERDGLQRAAALVHDALYRYRGKLPDGMQEILLPDGRWRGIAGVTWAREEADKLFARILRECGVSKFQRRLMYLGVRAGGWVYWNSKTKRS